MPQKIKFFKEFKDEETIEFFDDFAGFMADFRAGRV
jgi:hypothetical protein